MSIFKVNKSRTFASSSISKIILINIFFIYNKAALPIVNTV